MSQVQATWTPDSRLFCWSVRDPLELACARELPDLLLSVGAAATRQVVIPGERPRRVKVDGLDLSISEALRLLTNLNLERPVSDSVRCWSVAAKLALQIAISQQVAPTVINGEALWKALFIREQDQRTLERLIDALPTSGRSVPTGTPSAPRLLTTERALRSFIDQVIDSLYRRGVWPGPSLGWAHDLAQALTGPNRDFSPREARLQNLPTTFQAWSSGADSSSLTLELRLELPRGRARTFPLRLYVTATHDDTARAPILQAWRAGASFKLGDSLIEHPAYYAMRDLSRASRLWSPLAQALRGPEPEDLKLGPDEVWSFLSRGVGALRGAGLRVGIPKDFEQAGARRIRARMRIEARDDGHRLALSEMLSFRWEVTLGDQLIEGSDFKTLLKKESPVVRFQNQWVLLDPAEIRRLPDDLGEIGNLPAAEALRAVLTGEYRGVPVIADEKLDLVLRALRDPPETPLPEGFQGTLRPYQTRGYSWLTTLGRMGLGCCLADDMGLGKTVQLIAHLLDRRGRPHLVVCPTSVLGNWRREIQRFAPTLKVLRYHGVERKPQDLSKADVVLTTYGLLSRDVEALREVAWDVFALDEAQAIKNPDSKRARAARSIQASHRVALSGTPVENRLDELWSIMEFLVPGLLGPRRTFERNVAIPIERFGDEAVAHSLKLGIAPFLLRRLKSDPAIIDDLPDKIERKDFVPLSAEQARLYQQVVDEAMEQIELAETNERRTHVFSMLTKLKQVCNHPAQYLKEPGRLDGRSGKLERFSELVELIVRGGERAIIFSQYRQMGDLLVRHLEEHHDLPTPFLHGGTPAEKREEMVRSFQEDDDASPILLVSLRAGGTGLNLTRATHVIHYDRWWNPAVEDQATDRAYRIGQRQNVQVHKMITQGTLEERIDQLLEDKRALADQVVGSGEGLVAELDDSALRMLVSLGEDAMIEEDP
ncbi:MAG: DEAD/DEAH box helicase [Deltaproteobacteria bacterium]|nr:MAG: DEAD/DEAH box helicase [Deltaproteobacteria bacterium]